MSYITSIVRISGWSDHYVLWELPYAQGLGMIHADAVYNSQKVEFVHGRPQEAAAPGMRDEFRRMRNL